MAGLADSLNKIWAENVHAVYNPLNRVIGYFVSDQQLASAHINLNPGEAIGTAASWRVKDHLKLFSPLVPASEYLIRRGLFPSWISKAEAQAVATKINPPAPTIKLFKDPKPKATNVPPSDPGILPPVDVSTGILPNPSDLLPSGFGSQTQIGTYLIWGLVGLVVYKIASR